MVATLSQKELISQVKEKGWEITRGEKPKPLSVTHDVQNEKLIKSVVNALEAINRQSKASSENLIHAAEIMANVGKTEIESKRGRSRIEGKRKWNMDVVRDGQGLIKSIVAEEI